MNQKGDESIVAVDAVPVGYARKARRNPLLRFTRRYLPSILLLTVGLIYLYPFLWMVSASLKSLPEIATSGPNLIPPNWRFGNYATAWVKARFSRYFFNTLLIATVPTVTSIFTISMTGYALSKKFLGGRIFMAATLVTMFIPGGLTVFPVFHLMRVLGLIQTRLGLIFPGLIGYGFNTLIFMAYYTSISSGAKNLEEAAKIDGANFPQTYFYVMLPMGQALMATFMIMGFIGGWNSFEWPLIIALGRPELRTLGVGLYVFRGENVIQWDLLMAGTTIAIVPILLLFFFAQRFIIESVSGALKM